MKKTVKLTWPRAVWIVQRRDGTELHEQWFLSRRSATRIVALHEDPKAWVARRYAAPTGSADR